MKDPKEPIALTLCILAISLAIFGCVYVLHMFWVIYPDRLAPGGRYWFHIVLLTAPLFCAMVLHLLRLMRAAIS